MDPDPSGLGSGRNCFPTTVLRRGRGARGSGSPTPPAPRGRGPGEAQRSAAGVCAPSRLTARHGNQQRPPGPSQNPTQRARKFRKRNCDPDSRSLPTVARRLPGVVSGPPPRHRQRHPGQWPRLSPHGRPPCPRGASLGTRPGPQPAPPGRRPELPPWRGSGRRDSGAASLPALLRLVPTKEDQLGPARILWNVLCTRLWIRFHRHSPVQDRGVFGALEGTARLSSGGVRRPRGEGIAVENGSCKRTEPCQAGHHLGGVRTGRRGPPSPRDERRSAPPPRGKPASGSPTPGPPAPSAHLLDTAKGWGPRTAQRPSK